MPQGSLFGRCRRTEGWRTARAGSQVVLLERVGSERQPKSREAARPRGEVTGGTCGRCWFSGSGKSCPTPPFFCLGAAGLGPLPSAPRSSLSPAPAFPRLRISKNLASPMDARDSAAFCKRAVEVTSAGYGRCVSKNAEDGHGREGAGRGRLGAGLHGRGRFPPRAGVRALGQL